MPRAARDRGFTLIDLLVVVVLLVILAAAMIPQFDASTEDAKVSALKTSLAQIRSAVELYRSQHNGTYPGVVTSGIGTTAAAHFAEQLTLYTQRDGAAAAVKDATHKYGPYLKDVSLKPNPFNDLDTVLIDGTTPDAADRATDGSTGWKFYTKTGIFIANDKTTLSDGATKTASF